MNDSVSRRTFIGTAAAVVAGSAAMPGAAQTDRRIRTGIVGAGDRGRQLLRRLDSIDRVAIAAVCDDYRPHLDAATRFVSSASQAYDDFNDMLAKEELDALIVATPPNEQHGICMAAVERGVAVYCETPMCLTLTEARDLARTVEAHNAIFQVGLQRRSNAVYEQAAAMVQTGMLGDVTAVKCQWHIHTDERRALPVSAEHPDYETLERKLNWRLYGERSRGLTSEYGIHQLDVVNRMLGTAPRRVIAMGGNDYWHDGRELYDNVFCTYEYDVRNKDGASRMVRATFSSMLTNAHEGVTELIMGTKGTLLLSPKMGLFYREQQNGETEAPVDGRSGATVVLPDSPWAHRGKSMEITSDADDTRAALVAFVDAVHSGNQNTVCDARTGLESMATAAIGSSAIPGTSPVMFPDDCRREPA